MNPRSLVVLMVLGPMLAGCVSQPTPPGPPLPPPEPRVYTPICAISNWADACTVKASDNEAPSKAEIDMAVNPTNPLNVFIASKDLDRKASNCVWAVGHVTKDGGKTWKTTYIGGTKDQRQDPTNPLFGWDCITDPIMTFGKDGTLYYPLQAYNFQGGGPECPHEATLNSAPVPLPVNLTNCGGTYYMAISRDGGETFPSIITLVPGDGNVVFHDFPRVLENPKTGTISAIWNAYSAAQKRENAIVVSTRDHGQTAAPPVLLKAPNSLNTSFNAGFAATRDGTLYATIELDDRDNKLNHPLYLATSTDDGQSFQGYAKMFDMTDLGAPSGPLPHTKFRTNSNPDLAADNSGGPHDGRLYAVWGDGRNGNADILSSRSDDKGKTWSEPVRVNQDNTTSAQWMQRTKVGDDGTVHVLYMDRQYSPNDTLYDATYAWSTDGAATWHTRRLTSLSSNGDLGVHQNGFPFIGDYVGVATVGNHLYFGFPSTITGKAEIAVAHLMRPPGNATKSA